MKSLQRHLQQSGLRAHGTIITMRWVPAHEGVYSNELAHKYAQKSTTRGNEVDDEPAPQPKLHTLGAGRTRILKE
jgi:hypothetical protein